MKIYSNTLTEGDLYRVIADANNIDKQVIYIVESRSFKPRTGFANGIEFWAEGDSSHASAHRPIGSYSLREMPRAATWTAYGYVIARLFALDPSAKIGQYKSKQDFIRQVQSQWPYRSRLKRESISFLELVHHSPILT